MSSEQNHTHVPESSAAQEATLTRATAAIMAAGQAAADVPGFLERTVRIVGDALNSPFSLLYARSGPNEIRRDVHRGGSDPGFWRPAVQRFLTDTLRIGEPRARLLSAREADLQIALLAVPFADEGDHIEGGIALVVRSGQPYAATQLHRLEALVATITAALDLVGQDRTSAAAQSDTAATSAVAKAAAVETPEQLCFNITNSLRKKLDCEQVALGLVRKHRVKLVSISGLDDINHRSPGTAQIRAAMEECFDSAQEILCQHERDWDESANDAGFRLHRHWYASAGGDGVGSVPLFAGQQCVAVLSLRWPASETMRREQLREIRRLVEPYMPALDLVRRAGRGLLRHAWDTVDAGARGALRPGNLGLKIAIVALVAFGAWFCLGTLPYRPSVAARVVPAEQRYLAAPFEGTLASVAASQGDLVRAGDVLCKFDTRQLQLRRDELLAEQAVYDQEQRRALADNTPVEARLAAANAKLVQAQLATIERRLELATIRAPYDGIIVRGDLRQQIGSVMALGSTLYEIAPINAWQLELEAPQSLAANLTDCAAGDFAAAARPESPQPFDVQRLRPSAEVRAGKNVYVIEAALNQQQPWLRPGMEGVARLDLGTRPVWWLALHGFIDYLRLHYWL